MERMGVYSTIHHPSSDRLEVVRERIKEIELEEVQSLDDAWSALDAGDLDLVLAPANLVWNERIKLASMQFDVVAALTLAKELGVGKRIVTLGCDNGIKYLGGHIYS